MYNDKSKNNLIHLNERTEEERKAIAKSGGKASIESKQEKKKFKDYFNSLLEEKKDIIRNGKKVKITKKEYIACKLTDTLISERELDYKDIQAIKLLLEIIEEKPVDNLININNTNKQNTLNIIDDCDNRKATILEIKQIRHFILNKDLSYKKTEYLTEDLLIDSIIAIQLHLAELRRKGNKQRINEILQEIQNEDKQNELLEQEDSFFYDLSEARKQSEDLSEQADTLFEDNEQLKKLAKTYIKMQDWEKQQ